MKFFAPHKELTRLHCGYARISQSTSVVIYQRPAALRNLRIITFVDHYSC
jgi:hypothetical protein